MIKLIDTHCHLEMGPFDPDREAVIQRARDAGLEAMITIGSDLKGNVGGVALSQKYDFIYAAVGLHPHDAKDFTEEIFNQIKAWARDKAQGARHTGHEETEQGASARSLPSVKSVLTTITTIRHVRSSARYLWNNCCMPGRLTFR